MAQMGFFDLSDRYASLDAKKDPLAAIDAVVPWDEFRPGLRVDVRRADHERPLCGEVEGSDVLKELPKFSLGCHAHGSIRVQEGQPVLP